MQLDIVVTNNQLLNWDLLKDSLMYSTEKPWFFTEFSFLFVFGFFLLFYTLFVKQQFWRKLYIIAFSLFFYFKSSGPFLLLFVFMICMDYLFAIQIDKSKGWKRKILLLTSILLSLSFLLYFKYSNFFISNVNYIFKSDFSLGELFLPIGISFYTFQSISYIIDVYKKEIPPTKSFSDYTFYMTFFPHLVAGPIVRAKDFIPQIKNSQVINKELFRESLMRIVIGLVKKLFIADYLAKYVDLVHLTPDGFSGGEQLISMYAYSFQIYFDFSGYSDIAIGIALLLGYRLKENFDNPYGSKNITEFWRKWHISLSLWLRDYIYIPLGGNRKGTFNLYLFLIITMLVGGFWHGADWRFVFWGLAHGLALVLHKIVSKHIKIKPTFFTRMMGVFFTFNFVSICWIFFRATSFESAFACLKNIFTKISWVDFEGFWIARPEILYILFVAAFICFFPFTIKDIVYKRILRIPSLFWFIILLISLQIIIQFKDDVVQPFIYFQF